MESDTKELEEIEKMEVEEYEFQTMNFSSPVEPRTKPGKDNAKKGHKEEYRGSDQANKVFDKVKGSLKTQNHYNTQHENNSGQINQAFGTLTYYLTPKSSLKYVVMLRVSGSNHEQVTVDQKRENMI